MNKLTAIRILNNDDTYSDEIPVSVLAENVEWDTTHNLIDILGEVDIDTSGNLQNQINEKLSGSQLNNYVANQLNNDVTTWLNSNVNPIGSAVIVDNSLSIDGAAADAKKVGNIFSSLNEDITYDINKLKTNLNSFTINNS